MPVTRKSRMKKRKPTVAKLARDVAKLKANEEYKSNGYTDIGTVPVLGTIHSLCQIAQGPNVTERVGSKTSCRSSEGRVLLTINPSVTMGYTNVRMILFIHKNSNGTLPLTSQVLQSVSLTGPRNLTLRSDIVILKEWYALLTLVEKPTRLIKWYRKLNFQTLYSTAAGTEAAIQNNSLYLMIMGDASINLPAVDIYHRLRYVDS